MSEHYIYLFTRTDLSIPQQIIQTAHATHAMAATQDSRVANAVLIGVESEDKLLEISEYLDENDIDHEMFWELDISAYTSICSYPLQGKERKPLKKFSLM